MRDLLIITFCLLSIGVSTSYSQSFNIDSMYQVFSDEKKPEKKKLLLDSLRIATPFSDSLSSWTITNWMIEHAKEINDVAYEGKAYLFQGHILEHIGHFEKSIEILEKGSTILKQSAYETGDSLQKTTLAYTYGTISNSLLKRNEFSEGMKYLQMTEQVFIELKDSMNLGRCYNSYALFYQNIGQDDEAANFYRKALTIFLRHKFTGAMVMSHMNLATIRLNQNRLDKAEEHINEALILQEKDKMKNKQNDETRLYRAAAELYLTKGDFDKATEYANQVIQINRNRGNDFGEASGHLVSADIGFKTNDLKKIQLSLKNAKPLIPAGYDPMLYEWKRKYANYYIEIGNFKDADRLLDDCQEYFGSVSDLLSSSNIYRLKATLEKKRGNEKGVFENLEKHYHFKDSISNQNALINRELYDIQYETEKKKQEIKLLSEKEKVQTAEITSARNRNSLLLALLALLLAGGGAIYYRRQLSEQMRLQTMRSQISSDLHDEVGSSLAQLSMIMGSVEDSDSASAKKYLKKGNEVLMTSISKIRDVVWAIDASNDEAGSLLDRMEDFAYDMFSAKEIKYKINTDGFDRKEVLPPNIRQNFYLFYKEAVTNIHKHSNATEVNIDISRKGKNVSLTVADNGQDVNDKKVTGSGISNMELRAKKIGGTFDLQKGEDGFVVRLEAVV